jgi:uncharacterized membrane protein
MKPVESSVVINRPIEACFAYLTDLANDVEWRREWIDAEKTTDGPHGVGARYRLTGALLGRRIATEYETIAYEPTRLAAWKAVSGPLPLTFSRAFDGVEGGTRITMRYEGDSRLLRLAGPLIAGIGRRQLEGDYPKLKQVPEPAPS